MENESGRERSPPGTWAWGILALLLFPGCGAGVVAVAASAGDSGGGTTPALDSFIVESPRVSPAKLRLTANRAVSVALFYDLGQGPLPMTNLDGRPTHEVDLPAGELELSWDFAADPDVGASFHEDVRLTARLGADVISGGEVLLVPGLGNDVPVVERVDPMPTDPLDPSESSGNVEVRIEVRDTSSDVVSLTVKWRRASDPPNAWQTATPAGVFPEGVETRADGVEVSFFWATNVDLRDVEEDVLLQVTPDDRAVDSAGLPVGEGRAVESELVHVDNNAAPIVQLDSGPLVLNPDERRGIPIPFRVIDEEDDLVDVLFQWRREGEEFPSLDADGDGKLENAELAAILADPVLRRERHVCSEYPRHARGLVVPVDEDTVRLPELAASEAWILPPGIVGKTLELLRPSSIPQPITPTWPSNPLVSPVAALPAGDGRTALVLDAPVQGRLREIELATGAIVREIATLGAGAPSALAACDAEAVLVALDDAGTWRIERVELASGAISELVASDGTEPGPVRGLACLGTRALLFTAGSSLFHLDHRDALAPRLARRLAGLATPWGLAVDPLSPTRVYVAERDANRVLAVELDSHEVAPVVVRDAAGQPRSLDAPRALALERDGSRLLVVTNSPGGRELLGLELGARGGNVAFPIGDPTGGLASVATGPDGLRLLCLPGSDELLVAGGLEQRRAIAAHASTTLATTVAEPFDPLPRSGEIWRIRAEPLPLRASAGGAQGLFVWDSGDAGEGRVFLRAVARDDEPGASVESLAPKAVRSALDVAPLVVGGSGTTNFPQEIVATDVDGDGDLDLASANNGSETLTVFRQDSPGSFSGAPLVLGGPGVTVRPAALAAGDLDGDGDPDLVAANSLGNDLTLFRQLSPGGFAAVPVVIGGPAATASPRAVVAADLDGDGDLDLASANTLGDDLTVFRQEPAGVFALAPVVLGGSGITSRPSSLVAADLDGDGDLDLASANEQGDDLTVFRQESPGGFALAPLVLGGPGTTDFPVALAAADLDGDGGLDLVSANADGGDLTVFLQEPMDGFALVPVALVTPVPPVAVAPADLDGDDDQDLAAVHGLGNVLTIFRASSGSFETTPLVLESFAAFAFPSSLAAADLDGDGDHDLATANLGSDDLTVLLQESPGSAGTVPLVLGGLATTVQPESVAVADLDGDGDLDVVSANCCNLTVFAQSSPGAFESAPRVVGTTGARSVVAADVDGDGDHDLVAGLALFPQVAPGEFASLPQVVGTAGARAVVAADLDEDGDLDLVSANDASHTLTVFLQESQGSYALAPLVLGGIAITNRPVSVAAADLDGDGDRDLVSANELGDDLTIFEQVAPGTFTLAPPALGGPGITINPRAVAAVDLDGDGDQDLVSADLFGHHLSVFLQGPPGSFALFPRVLGPISGPVAVTAADLDGDGDQDLAAANEFDSDLRLFLQEASGSFTPLVRGGGGTTISPSAIAAADIDGDGDPDLVSANRDGNDLTVFWGGR